MKYSILQLKDIQNRITDGFGLTPAQAARIVGHYNGSEELDKIAAGDFSPVESACNLLGFTPTKTPTEKKDEKTTKKTAEKPKRTPRKSTIKQEMRIQDSDILPTVKGEIITDDDGLPADFAETLTGWLEQWATDNNIDLEKCAGLQWRAACIYIGQRIKQSGILLDHERLRTHGGNIIYKPERVAALLPIWEYLTARYKHIPLACDFISLSGVSEEWFYDTAGRLTSSRVGIAQKARAIEEKGISAGLTDGRENPTGRIYYSKARLGWRETTEIIHTTAKETTAAAVLPVFDDNSGLLEG